MTRKGACCSTGAQSMKAISTRLLTDVSATFLFSGLVVLLGIGLACELGDEPLTLKAVFRFDAEHYQDIARVGYSYCPEERPTVAFFPAYPVTAAGLKRLTGMSTRSALSLVANLYLYAAFLLFAEYLTRRRADNAITFGGSQRVDGLTLLAFALFPPTFFLRMPYAEASLLFFAILSFVGMQRGWPMLLIAIIVGAATATRPVGVALVPVLALHIFERTENRFVAVGRFTALLPLALWGLLAYMLMQYVAFGDALAFANTQQHWRVNHSTGLCDKAIALLSLEPIWSVYVSGSPSYWRRWSDSPLFSLYYFNPIYFASITLFVGLGWSKRWLDARETALSAGLLLIPYLTRAYENGMFSHARFSAVVFPAYIVMGRMLAALPQSIAISLIVLSGFMLGAYTAMFAGGKPFF